MDRKSGSGAQTAVRPAEGPRLSRRTFLGVGCGALLSGMVATVLTPLYATQVEPNWIEVTEVDVPVRGLPAALEGFSITLLGDFHVGQYVSAGDVRRSVQVANGLGADLIVLSGDFVYGAARHSATCAKELAALEARHGVYSVLGNHDIWTDADEVARNVEEAGIAVLRDDVRAIHVGSKRVWLLGIEDTGYTAGFFGGSFKEFQTLWRCKREALAALMSAMSDDGPRLLLVHNPDFTEMLPDGRIDLALCGHTHGGQVRLPLLGSPVVPSCFAQKYACGLVRGPKTAVYVNRGIGLISPPVRFNCRPEVTLLGLRAG